MGSGVNVFMGANGQGKTNLLEAVAMLALSSSPRSRRELEVIGPVAAESRIEAVVESAGRGLELSLSLRLEGERTHRVIEVAGARRRAFELPGHFRVTLFWPDDLGLIKGGPELRRRFLNHLLVQIQPGYARALSGLKRVLEQRNSLLKRIAAGEEASAVLDVWDEELVKIGGEISRARAEALRQLAPIAARRHAEIGGGEALVVEYVGPPDDLAMAVHNALAEDLRRGSTSVGPHRDDIRVLLDGQEARSYGSQGQQRTAVVSLKLAEAEVVERRTGERPVLLLDDVLSELDLERRAALLRQVTGGGQVVITSVDAGPFPPDLLDGAKVWKVDHGQVQACG